MDMGDQPDDKKKGGDIEFSVEDSGDFQLAISGAKFIHERDCFRLPRIRRLFNSLAGTLRTRYTNFQFLFETLSSRALPV